MWGRWRGACAIWRSPTTPCKATMRGTRCAEVAAKPVIPLLERGAAGLRIAVASGYFKCKSAEAFVAVDRVAAALGVNRDIEIPQAERARSAAFIITASEGASLHLDRLRRARRLRSRRARPADRGRHDAGGAGGKGAKVSPLVSRRGLEAVCRGRRHTGAGNAVHRAADRSADVHARRSRIAGAGQSRPLHPADLLHRPPGRCRTGAAGTAADRGPNHRGAVARGRSVAHCSCARKRRCRRRNTAARRNRTE